MITAAAPSQTALVAEAGSHPQSDSTGEVLVVDVLVVRLAAAADQRHDRAGGGEDDHDDSAVEQAGEQVRHVGPAGSVETVDAGNWRTRTRSGRVVTHHATLDEAPTLYRQFDQREHGVITAVLQQ
jgi:hypothetical protein